MRCLPDDEADCFFCGEEQSNVSSEAWEQDGELRAWLVCLTCGTSNQIRIGMTRSVPAVEDPEEN